MKSLFGMILNKSNFETQMMDKELNMILGTEEGRTQPELFYCNLSCFDAKKKSKCCKKYKESKRCKSCPKG